MPILQGLAWFLGSLWGLSGIVIALASGRSYLWRIAIFLGPISILLLPPEGRRAWFSQSQDDLDTKSAKDVTAAVGEVERIRFRGRSENVAEVPTEEQRLERFVAAEDGRIDHRDDAERGVVPSGPQLAHCNVHTGELTERTIRTETPFDQHVRTRSSATVNRQQLQGGSQIFVVVCAALGARDEHGSANHRICSTGPEP